MYTTEELQRLTTDYMKEKPARINRELQIDIISSRRSFYKDVAIQTASRLYGRALAAPSETLFIRELPPTKKDDPLWIVRFKFGTSKAELTFGVNARGNTHAFGCVSGGQRNAARSILGPFSEESCSSVRTQSF